MFFTRCNRKAQNRKVLFQDFISLISTLAHCINDLHKKLKLSTDVTHKLRSSVCPCLMLHLVYLNSSEYLKWLTFPKLIGWKCCSDLYLFWVLIFMFSISFVLLTSSSFFFLPVCFSILASYSFMQSSGFGLNSSKCQINKSVCCACHKWCSAGFIKSPLSQMKLIDDDVELHCEVIGNPIPEVQWWFVEGEEPNETFTQLFDGARNDRVQINATYIAHATSTIHLTCLTFNDSGTYECRASNDPDRNELKKTPKIKWIRSQANVIVIESELQWELEETLISVAGCSLLISKVLLIQLNCYVPEPSIPSNLLSQNELSLSLPSETPILCCCRKYTWPLEVAGLAPSTCYYLTQSMPQVWCLFFSLLVSRPQCNCTRLSGIYYWS